MAHIWCSPVRRTNIRVPASQTQTQLYTVGRERTSVTLSSESVTDAQSRPSTHRRNPPSRGSCCAGLRRAVGALDDARHFYARCNAELAEGVAQVGFDRLRAEKELGRDLRVGLSVDDESSDLKFALGE